MSPIAKPAVAGGRTRVLGSITVIDTPLVTLDYGGLQYEQIPTEEMNSILKEFPRLDMKRGFTDSVCRIVKAKPETTYDNFARDFGERFVTCYKPKSTVDFLMNAPFQE